MGEICSLQWRQINWTEGKLYLQAQDTKTSTPRVLYLTGDLYRVLHTWKSRCDLKWPACLWICHRGGIPTELEAFLEKGLSGGGGWAHGEGCLERPEGLAGEDPA